MGGGDDKTNEFKPPEWTAERFPGAMSTLDRLASTPYSQFMGQKVAGINPWQHGAGQLTVSRALDSDPQTQAARGSIMSISQGGAANPFIDNAWTDRMIANNTRQMTEAYLTGSDQDMDAAAIMQGAFGGSGHSAAKARGVDKLQRAVGDMSNQVQAQEIARKGGLWSDDVNKVLQASAMSPEFSRLDQESFDALMKYGQFMQNQEQALLTDRYQEHMAQQGYPMQMLDWYLSGLSRGSGQYGTNYQTGPGASPWGTAAGLGMTAYGMFGR